VSSINKWLSVYPLLFFYKKLEFHLIWSLPSQTVGLTHSHQSSLPSSLTLSISHSLTHSLTHSLLKPRHLIYSLITHPLTYHSVILICTYSPRSSLKLFTHSLKRSLIRHSLNSLLILGYRQLNHGNIEGVTQMKPDEREVE